MEGPDKPLVRLEQEPVDIFCLPGAHASFPTLIRLDDIERWTSLAVTAKDLAREVFRQQMDRFLELRRSTHFDPDQRARNLTEKTPSLLRLTCMRATIGC
jgi:hypothetical protein